MIRAWVWSVLLLSCTFLRVEAKYQKDKYAIGLFAATALSHGVREFCMGRCYGTGEKKCRVGWGASDIGTDCNYSKHKFVTRRYTTYSHGTTKLCMSDCDHFGGYSQSWCVTEDTWYECTALIPNKVWRRTSSKNDYYHCLDGCDDTKGWCYTYPSSWQHCKSSRTVYITDNPTTEGTRCASRCAATDESKLTFKCYDTNKEWVSCYPSPDATNIVKSFHRYARKHRATIKKSGTLVSCNVFSRRRRDDYDVSPDDVETLELEEIFNGVNTVEQMATLLERWYPSETLRWPDPTAYPDPSQEPIISYSVRVVPGVFGQPQIVLPMVVRAVYSRFTRATLERSSSYDETNYANQDPRPGDHHGHLVQHALGGTEDGYNIVPQSSGLNLGGPWARLERIMRNYIQNHPDGTVEHTIVVNYDFTSSYRPTSFAIRVRFYGPNREPVNEYGHPLPNNSFANNVYENFYLVNEDEPCGQ